MGKLTKKAVLRVASPRSPAWRGALYYLLYWAFAAVGLPYLNVHYTRIGLSGFEVGVLSALGPLMRLTSGPSLSALADRRGWQKAILALMLALMGFLVFLLGLFRSFLLILPVVFFISVAQSAISPIADAIVARMARRHRVDYGKLRLWGSLGFAVVSVGTGAIWERLGFDAMFLVAALASLPVILATLGLEEERRSAESGPHPPLITLAQDRGLVALVVANFLIGMGEGLYITFAGIYMDAIGGGELLIGSLFGLSALVELPVMQYGSALTRRIGKPGALILAYVVLGLGYFGFAVAETPAILLVCAMMKGVGFGLYFPTTVSLADDRAPAAWTSTVQSLLMALGWGLAPLITIPIAGWLSDQVGLAQIFWLAGATQLLAGLVLGGALVGGAFRTAPLVEFETREEVT
jgi:PPP family 3-phenylpropionic acid transporter